MGSGSVSGHGNQKVDKICVCLGTGGGGITYGADNVRITSQGVWIKEPQSGVCTGIAGESKHYCADGRRKHCEFVFGIIFIFIGVSVGNKEQALCQHLTVVQEML